MAQIPALFLPKAKEEKPKPKQRTRNTPRVKPIEKKTAALLH